MISLEGKLEFLLELDQKDHLSTEDMRTIEQFSSDDTDEVRIRVAEILNNFSSDFSDKLLLKLIDDKSELVRVNACDSLCNSVSTKAIEALKPHAVKDTSLVRAYAIMSILDIATNTNYSKDELIKFYMDSLKKERVHWVKIYYYKVLYCSGIKSFFPNLINELNSRNYRTRIAVVKCLMDVLDDENIDIIKELLIKRLNSEKAESVRDCIKRLLKQINSY